MKKEIVLLTGPPGIGKTTIIRKILANLSTSASGFFTREIRQKGMRVGFEIVTLDGKIKTMAHVELKKRYRIGKYGVDLSAIEELAVGSILRGIEKNTLLIIDEIGPMEILSENFRDVVVKAIISPCPILATIGKQRRPFLNQVKSHKYVRLIEVDRSNRNQLPRDLLKIFRQGDIF